VRIATSHFGHWSDDRSTKELEMIALGLILLIIGLVAGIGILTTIGLILLVVGLILNLVPIGGSTRRVW
jgi:membrane-bound ClpP family serine protease